MACCLLPGWQEGRGPVAPAPTIVMAGAALALGGGEGRASDSQGGLPSPHTYIQQANKVILLLQGVKNGLTVQYVHTLIRRALERTRQCKRCAAKGRGAGGKESKACWSKY